MPRQWRASTANNAPPCREGGFDMEDQFDNRSGRGLRTLQSAFSGTRQIYRAGRSDEVLVRVARQRHLRQRSAHRQRASILPLPLPVTIGHEFSGDVAAVGSAVDNVQRGTACHRGALHRVRQVRCLPPRRLRLLRAHQLHLPQRRRRHGGLRGGEGSLCL